MFKLELSGIKRWMKHQTNLGRFFACFIAGNLLVAGLFGTLLYLRAARSLEQETIEANHNMLIQLNRSADLLLAQIDQSINRLAMEPSVIAFMGYYQSQDFLNQIKMNAVIDNHLLASRYINSISIFYFNDDKVYSANRGVRDLNDFPDREIFEAAKAGKVNYNWLPTRRLFDERSGKTINVITIIKPIPLGSFDPEAVIAVNLEEGFLRDSMNAIKIKDELDVLVVNEQGRIISSAKQISADVPFNDRPWLQRAFDQKAGNYIERFQRQKMLVSFVTSEMFGWKYISEIPYEVIVDKIGFIRKYAIIILFFAIIWGSAAAFFFSNKIFKPIQLIAGLFKDKDDSSHRHDILKYIEKNVNRLVKQNETIEKTFYEHMSVLRNNFLTGFLRGAVADPRVIQERFKYYGINLGTSSRYLVYLVALDHERSLSDVFSERQLNILVIYLMEVLNSLSAKDHRKMVVNTKENEIAVIFGLSQNSDVAMEAEIERLGQEILQAVQTNGAAASVAVGTMKHELSRIADSYSEALEALHYKVLIGNQKVLRYEAIRVLHGENYEYPYPRETQLVRALKAGDIQGAKEINRELFEFFSKCNATLGDAVYYHYMQLLSAIIRCALEIGLNIQSLLGGVNLYQELLKCDGMTEVQAWFSCLYEEFSNQVQRRKDTKNGEIIEGVVNYVEVHYDQDLSLTVLSQQVFMSVPYLSAVFREAYGKPLKQFINEVRIEKAKEFLSQPNYRIVEVAQKVGYDKVHAFLRLFKEYTGLTPGQYRKGLVFGGTQAHGPAGTAHLLREQ